MQTIVLPKQSPSLVLSANTSHLQEREHKGTYAFHLEFGDTLTPLQFVKAMAYSHAVGVKPWPMAQLLAAKDAQDRGLYAASLPLVEELHGPSDFYGSAAFLKVHPQSGGQATSAASLLSQGSYLQDPASSSVVKVK